MAWRRCISIAAASIAGFALALGLFGVPWRDALTLSVVVVVQAATGAVIWGRLRPHRPNRIDALELVGMGLAIGTALALLSGVTLGLLVPSQWWWSAPTVVVALVVLARRQPRVTGVVWLGGLWAALAGLALGGLGLALNLVRYPLSWAGVWDGYHRDMLFFEALGNSVARYGPNESIFMTGASLRYHWFAYAWAGQLTDATGAVPFAALTRVLPLVALIGTVTLAVAWARAMSDRPMVPFVAAVLVVFGGYVGAVNGTILNFESPSQAMTTMWLLAFVVALLGSMRSVRRWLDVLVVVLMTVMLAGGKVSASAVALGGIWLTAVVAMIRRETWRWRAIGLAVLTSIAAGLVFVLVVAGNTSSGDLLLFDLDRRASTLQELDSSTGARGAVIGTLTLMVAMASRWVGVGWLLADRKWRWRPETVLGVGMGLVGALALAILSQGVNETWFSLSASAPLAVLSAVGLGLAWEGVRDRRALIVAVIAGLAITPVVVVLWAHGWPGNYVIRFWAPWAGIALALAAGGVTWLVARRHGWRVLLAGATTALLVVAGVARVMPIMASGWVMVVGDPALQEQSSETDGVVSGPEPIEPLGSAETPATVIAADTVPQPRERSAWSPLEAEAAAWLRRTAGRSDVLVTNETLGYLVPALTGLRTYMSGATYQGVYGNSASVPEIPGRVATSMAFTTAPDEATFSALCRADVTYAWLANDLAPAQSWVPYSTPVFANEAVTVTRLDRSRCP